MADPKIFIRPEAFGVGFDVTVEPTRSGQNLNAEYPTHKAAFGYAIGLRMIHGWPVVDLSAGYVEDLLGAGKGGGE